MAGNDWFGDASILAFDIAGWSNGDHAAMRHDKIAAEEKLQRVVPKVRGEDRKRWWVDAGDGGFQLFPDELSQALDTLEEFTKQIRDLNTARDRDRPLKIRYTLHYGRVERYRDRSQIRFVGEGVNDCRRMLDGMDRTLVDQVVISDAYRSALIHFERSLEDLFTPLADTVAKHDAVFRAWNAYKTGHFGIPAPAAEERPPDPPR
jgi:class 3 adenylate cyclase